MNETRRPAKDIYLHTNNHIKLKQADIFIKQARELERQVEEENSTVRKLLIPRYSFKVSSSIVKEDDSRNNLPKGTETLYILATLCNKDIFDSHMKTYGSISMYPEETRSSLKYYRKHGLLFHTDGGWHLLKDEQPCSDKEWEQLKAGNIPKKFKK